ncbi:CRAL-TRIO domain-containing protein C3H8.02 [Impatiens glandulifera]|uniref:CRAL-TRIO domain-containing protein C3H8.02 n=1 Tax=Impatiens glandulifera TaxID=253017 RepID=UPI001FB0A6F0|nr:CRAL-TRIO domain-containing protein C3H8.02 [Impatiens glandulifera]
MALRLCSSFGYLTVPSPRSSRLIRTFSVQNPIVSSIESSKLVVEVKEKLQNDHYKLPIGRYGRDDEDMILWFLKDRKFSVEEAVSKLAKAIKWYHEFGVSELSEESIRSIAETGKSYLHEFHDTHGRPVLIVVASKHLPAKQQSSDSEKLCVFLIEKALKQLPADKQEILVILDLRGFSTENTDLKFLTFLFDVFYYYYPRRLSEVLFVEAPFVFKPVWALVKPLLKSYASLVRFCSVEDVRKEYFTESTLPHVFTK